MTAQTDTTNTNDDVVIDVEWSETTYHSTAYRLGDLVLLLAEQGMEQGEWIDPANGGVDIIKLESSDEFAHTLTESTRRRIGGTVHGRVMVITVQRGQAA